MKRIKWTILFLLMVGVYLSADLDSEKLPREETTCEDIFGTC